MIPTSTTNPNDFHHPQREMLFVTKIFSTVCIMACLFLQSFVTPTAQNATTLTQFTHARRHPYPRSLFGFPARCHSSVLQDCTCRKPCAPCAVSASLGWTRHTPLPTREVERSEAGVTGATGTTPAMRVPIPPTSLQKAATVVTYERHVRHAYTQSDSIKQANQTPHEERHGHVGGHSVSTVPQLHYHKHHASVLRVSTMGLPLPQTSGRAQ